MEKSTIEAVGTVYGYYTTPVGAAPLVNNVSEGDARDIAISSLQAASGVWLNPRRSYFQFGRQISGRSCKNC